MTICGGGGGGGKRHAPSCCLPTWNRICTVPIVQESGWAPYPVWPLICLKSHLLIVALEIQVSIHHMALGSLEISPSIFRLPSLFNDNRLIIKLS